MGKNIFKNVSSEEIYKTIVDLEGPKYAPYNMDALNKAGDYILNKLESYGIKAEAQEFYVQGFKEPFKNIVGFIGNQSKPAIVIGSHYDTVKNCPGANDNLSSVAVSLEIARVLSQMENPPTVIIAVFTLEEGHPGFSMRVEEKLFENNFLDSNQRFISNDILKFGKKISNLAYSKWKTTRKEITVIYNEILEELTSSSSETEINYIKSLIDVLSEFEGEFKDGKIHYIIGSQKFVEKVNKDNINVNCIINFDTLGWISDRPLTQKPLPLGKEFEPFISRYKTEIDSTVGNFIGVMAEKNSKPIYDEFLLHCKDEEIDIPYLGLFMPLEYREIENVATDTLRSDHAPFWRDGIPGIFVSDTANFRSDFYHTPADTYDRLNYEALAKITKATIKTLLTYKY